MRPRPRPRKQAEQRCRCPFPPARLLFRWSPSGYHCGENKMNRKIIAILAIGILLVAGEPRSKEFDLRIAERKIVEGPKVLRVRQNDAVTLRITADETEEFHLHG